jgi:hypothetical protein
VGTVKRHEAITAIREVLHATTCSPFAIALDLEQWYEAAGIDALDVALLIVEVLEEKRAKREGK